MIRMPALIRTSAALLCLLLAAHASLALDPASDELALLKTFREEFVQLTPGRDGFPAEFTMGTNDGPPSERPARHCRGGRCS